MHEGSVEESPGELSCRIHRGISGIVCHHCAVLLRATAVYHAGNELHFNCENHEHVCLKLEAKFEAEISLYTSVLSVHHHSWT